MDISYKCCICGDKFVGFGNNPWPITDDVNARCCDGCNETEVIPARILQIMENRRGTEQS